MDTLGGGSSSQNCHLLKSQLSELLHFQAKRWDSYWKDNLCVLCNMKQFIHPYVQCCISIQILLCHQSLNTFLTSFTHFYCSKLELQDMKTRRVIRSLCLTAIWLTCPSRLICTFLWSFHGFTRWWACWNGILALWNKGERNASYTCVLLYMFFETLTEESCKIG